MFVPADLYDGPARFRSGAEQVADQPALAGLTAVAPDRDHHALCGLQFVQPPPHLRPSPCERAGSRPSAASCSRCSFSGRAGVPHTTCPPRTIFEVRTPQPEPSTARALDARFVADAHLPADHGVVVHHHAAREAGLRRHHHVPPDAAVVRHVHHVVELGALADPGDAERGAVHAGVGADLDIAFDHHAADLRELFVVVARHHEPEAVGADDAAGVQDRARADVHVVVERDVGVQHASPRPATTRLPIEQPAPMRQRAPMRGARADAHLRSDRNIRADIGAFADHRRRVDAGFRRLRGMKRARARARTPSRGSAARISGAPVGIRKSGGTIRQPAAETPRLVAPPCGSDEGEVRRAGGLEGRGAGDVSISPSPSKVAPSHSANSRTRIAQL